MKKKKRIKLDSPEQFSLAMRRQQLFMNKMLEDNSPDIEKELE